MPSGRMMTDIILMIRLSPARIWLVSFLMYFAPAEIREM